MVATVRSAAATPALSDLVLDKIRQAPGLKDAGVTAVEDNGIVTLTGFVKSDAERNAVEEAASQVQGVKAIADDLQIKPAQERASAEIAREILKNLRSHVFLAAEDIMVVVRSGCVTLDGVVHQELQKMLADAQVKRVRGVSSLVNQITVKAEAALEEHVGQEDANERSSVDANGYFENGVWVETGEAEAG